MSNLPASSSKSVSFYTGNTTASNEKKAVVTITCLAVNAPAWTWNGTSSATAKFTSKDGKAFANAPAMKMLLHLILKMFI